MTPVQEIPVRVEKSHANVHTESIKLRPDANGSGMLLYIVTLELARIQQFVGFRHPGVKPIHSSFPIAAIAPIGQDYGGLETEPGFLLPYSESVRAGRELLNEIRADFSETDIAY